MATDSLIEDVFAPGELTIYLRNSEPIQVAQLSSALKALADDYRRYSRGGELVVWRAQNGSLKLILKAAWTAMQVMTVVVTLHDFAGIVGGHLEKTRQQGVDTASRAAGNRAAVEIFRLAAESGSDVKFGYTAPNGESLTFEIDAQEARHAVENPRYRAVSPQQPRTLSRSAAPASDSEWMTPFIADLKRAPSGSLSEHDQALLSIAVEAMRRQGSVAGLRDFADRLDKAGFGKEAQIVRAQI